MAAPSIRLHPEAIAKAKAAYEWYAECNPTAANAFISELDYAISQIHTTAREIQVITVAHGRRRPGYWRTRRSKPSKSISRFSPLSRT